MDIVTLQLGKRGVTREFLAEVDLALEKHKTVRVRMLRSALKASGKEGVVDAVLKHVSAKRVSCRGNTFVLERV